MKLPFNLRHPATDMNIVPGVHTTLISACKMADAGYVTVLYNDGVKIYDGTTAKITFSEKAILEGYQTADELWRLPLKEKVINKNTDTILMQRPHPEDAIAHVFELPST